jgi:VanZ family protein
VLAYVAVMYALSLDPGTPTPGVPGVDKVLHLVEYGILGLLLARGAGGAPALPLALLLIVMGTGIGIGDELIQSTVPGREAGAPDVVADVVGVVLGIWVGTRVFARPAIARWI